MDSRFIGRRLTRWNNSMSRRPFFFRAPFGVVVLLILGAPSLAQERIGGAAAIQNDVRGAVSEGVTKLNVGDGVYANEVITTAADSSGRFTFKDRTDVQIGPVSRVKLDDFVYSGERPAVFSATKGVFRFISAPAAHGAYEVHTPTATIGVRGTSFGVRAVSGRTDAVLYGGVIEVCQASGGKCRTLDSPCTFVSVTNRGVTDPRKLGSKDWSFDNSCKLPRRSDNRPGDPGTPLPGDAPPAQPPLQWTGFHIGVTGGSSIGSTKFADPIPLDGAAFSGGLTLGYNWQATPNILVGFESDFGFRGGIGGGSWMASWSLRDLEAAIWAHIALCWDMHGIILWHMAPADWPTATSSLPTVMSGKAWLAFRNARQCQQCAPSWLGDWRRP